MCEVPAPGSPTHPPISRRKSGAGVPLRPSDFTGFSPPAALRFHRFLAPRGPQISQVSRPPRPSDFTRFRPPRGLRFHRVPAPRGPQISQVSRPPRPSLFHIVKTWDFLHGSLRGAACPLSSRPLGPIDPNPYRTIHSPQPTTLCLHSNPLTPVTDWDVTAGASSFGVGGKETIHTTCSDVLSFCCVVHAATT